MEEIRLHVEAEINPTESQEKVRQAIRNVFGEIDLQVRATQKAELLVGDATGKESLANLCDLLRREHIRSAARTVFMEGIDKKTIRFCVNKQVAYARHFSFSKETAESPLGPIRVAIGCSNPQELVEWLTSRIS